MRSTRPTGEVSEEERVEKEKKKADRLTSRAKWVKDHPEEYAVEQAALTANRALMKAEMEKG